MGAGDCRFVLPESPKVINKVEAKDVETGIQSANI